jgi:hypothetical protein
MNEIINYPNYKVAATLAATVVYDGPAILIAGARQFSFHVVATNANIPAAVTLTVRKGAGAWTAVGSAAGLSQLGAGLVALDAGGAVYFVVVGDARMESFVSWDEARISITGHATLGITGLAVTAQVVSGNSTARVNDRAGVTS